MTLAVLIEAGRTRTFASALDWPGWSRAASSKLGAAGALDALDAYRERYAEVLARRDVATPTGRLRVVETVPGDATTDFGAPSQVAEADRRALMATERVRLARILEASWARFDEVAAVTGALRPGPRGGGRSVDKMAAHVAGAEAAYARKLGLRAAAREDPASVCALRAQLVDVITAARLPDREGAWPLRYGARRIAWHVLDHLFEMQDRSIVA